MSTSPKLTTYLFFDGLAETALNFYRDCLGGEIELLMRYGDAPDQGGVPEAMLDKVIHGCLRIGNDRLMVSDCPPGEQAYRGSQGFSIALDVDSSEEAERVFQALSADGEVMMPLSETFFALAFGMVKDRFGVSWMVSQPRECGSPGA